MKRIHLLAGTLALLIHLPAHAINARYAQQLERSGCTQASEMKGCDITKTKAQNIKAGFIDAPAPPADRKPASEQWTARASDGSVVARIRVDANRHVWVNDQQTKATRQGGNLHFHTGTISFAIPDGERGQSQGEWRDSDAGTHGQISVQ